MGYLVWFLEALWWDLLFNFHQCFLSQFPSSELLHIRIHHVWYLSLLRDFQPLMITNLILTRQLSWHLSFSCFVLLSVCRLLMRQLFSNSSFYVPKFQSYYLCFATTLLLFWGHFVRLFEVSLILCLFLLLICPYLGQSRFCALCSIEDPSCMWILP